MGRREEEDKKLMPPPPPRKRKAADQDKKKDEKADGNGGNEKAAERSTKKMRVNRQTETVVSTGSGSMVHMLKLKHEEFETYKKHIADLEAKQERLKHLLQKTKRSRQNLHHYNELIEQYETTKNDITSAKLKKPDEEGFYRDLQLFLDEYNRGRSASSSSAAGKKTDAADNKAEPKKDEVELKPKHHASIVTAGAPIYDWNQFEVLCMARADIDEKLKRQEKKKEKGGDGEQQSKLKKSKALFGALMAKEMRSQVSLDPFATPLLFVLAPLGTGVVSACSHQEIDDLKKAVAEWDQCNAGSAEDENNKKDKKAIKITIGKTSSTKGGEGDEQDFFATTVSNEEKKANNRLSVKMKDLRNTEHLSMLNFVSVQERERTEDEIQHANFREFLMRLNTERASHELPLYSCDTCEICGEAMDVDPTNGRVSCLFCGTTHEDGLDRIWQMVPHTPHSKFEYIKSGHLLTLLKRFQSREETIIPREIINRINDYLVHNKYNKETLTFKEMKYALKKVNLTRFYDHAWQILYIVTGRKPIQFTDEQEKEFQAVFDVLEEIYPLYKPKNAENFMFYYYVLGKTAQLLGYPQEIVDMFPLLKIQRKHMEKERLWEKMMRHVGWPVYPTYYDIEARKLMEQ